MPPVPEAALPDSVPVPLPLSTKVTPLGSAPFSERAGGGNPVVVTVNDPDAPAVKVALVALVMAGGPATVLVAVMVTGPPPVWSAT